MAVTQNTLIGRTRGSIGGVTFSSWKGLNVAKGKAENVQQPNSDAQLLQRSKMALIVALYRSVSAIIQTGFASLAIHMSEFNAFTSQNIKNAVAELTASTAELVYDALVFAKGTLTSTAIDTLIGTNGSNTVTFDFNPAQTAPDTSLQDGALAVCINETSEEIAMIGGSAVRSDGTVDIAMPTDSTTGDVIHGYLFFEKEDQTTVSDSQYLSFTVT